MFIRAGLEFLDRSSSGKYGIHHFLRPIFEPMAGLFGGLLGSKVRKPTMLPGFMAPQAV